MSEHDGEGGENDDGDPHDDLDGRPLEEAVETVVTRADAPDRGTVRTVLERVTEDGVVTRDAVDDELAHLSKVVSTPETRAELARIALSDARETAEQVGDLDVVATRLAEFEARVEEIEAAAGGLGEDLQDLIDLADDGDLYEIARGIEELTGQANRVQMVADDCQLDLEDFEKWVDTPAVRYRELDGDVDAAADSVDDLAEAVDELTRTDLAETGTDPALAWVDAAISQRTMELVIADLQAELAGLRTWADRAGRDDEDRLNSVERRLDRLDARVRELGDRLDDLAHSDWRDRYGETVDGVDEALDEFEPPVVWAEIQDTLDEHRSRIDGIAGQNC